MKPPRILALCPTCARGLCVHSDVPRSVVTSDYPPPSATVLTVLTALQLVRCLCLHIYTWLNVITVAYGVCLRFLGPSLIGVAFPPASLQLEESHAASSV